MECVRLRAQYPIETSTHIVCYDGIPTQGLRLHYRKDFQHNGETRR